MNGPLVTNPAGAWNALLFNLNLGSLGALVGASSFTAQLAIIWGTDTMITTAYPVSMGILLPGVNSSGQLFNLEGILKVTLDNIQLMYDRDQTAYLIKITDIALKLLGFTLPPGSQTDFFIFGDPQQQSNSLGWYGAFKKPRHQKQNNYII